MTLATHSGGRRLRTVLAGAAGVVMVLSGCSAAEEGTTAGEASSDELIPVAEGVTQYPLTLDTWLGETVLEERPQRVAVVGDGPASTNIDALELLGVTPVYVQKRPGSDYLWNEADWLDDPEIVDERSGSEGPNLERLAAAEPDLIIGVNQGVAYQDFFSELSDIAPVLEVAEQIPADQLDWRDTHTLIGETLDLGTAAADDVEEAEQAIAETAAAHPEFEGRTITLANDYGEEYGVEYYTVTDSVAEGIVGAMGFEPNPLGGKFVDDNAVSEENMADLDADVLVMFYTADQTRESRESRPLFQQVPAVADGRYVAVVAETDERAERGAIWALRRGMSPLSLPWTVEALADWAGQVELD